MVELVHAQINEISQLMGDRDIMIADRIFTCFQKPHLLGRQLLTGWRKPKGGQLADWQKENRQISEQRGNIYYC